jgi:hypothetical protein
MDQAASAATHPALHHHPIVLGIARLAAELAAAPAPSMTHQTTQFHILTSIGYHRKKREV